jgi:hypothetical protein
MLGPIIFKNSKDFQVNGTEVSGTAGCPNPHTELFKSCISYFPIQNLLVHCYNHDVR